MGLPSSGTDRAHMFSAARAYTCALRWLRSTGAVWLCLLPLALAVSLQRACSATLVSSAAPADAQGDALGALDAVSSLCRVVVPVLGGALATQAGAPAPFLAMAVLGLLGAAVCAQVPETRAVKE